MASNSSPLGILPHHSFLRKSSVSRLADFHYDPRTRVSGRAAFVHMQDHIERYYDGIEVLHSFEDSSGQIFDCVPFEQQPAVRNSKSPVPKPPDLSHAPYMGRAEGAP